MSASVMQPWPHEKSIPPEAECWICHARAECRHHVYPGRPNRTISEEEGCWVYLCHRCHRMVHAHMKMPVNGRGRVDSMRFLQETCQIQWMHANGKTVDDFRKRFGRSYV